MLALLALPVAKAQVRVMDDLAGGACALSPGRWAARRRRAAGGDDLAGPAH